MSDIRDKTINLRVSEEEKEKITQLAKSVDLDVSTLIRNAVLTDEKLVLLTGSSEIARGISKLITKFHRAAKNGIIDKKYCPVILTSLEELVSAFNQLMDKLPDISDYNE